MKETTACVLYDEPIAARQACRALRRARVGRPRSISIHQGEIWQDQYSFSKTRSRVGAVVGALVIGVPTALFLTFASSTAVLEVLEPGAAFVVGLFGGGLLGGLAGGLVGTTEPIPLLSHVQDAVRDGKVAVVADFRSPEQARRAGEVLAAQPGAISEAAIEETSSKS